MSTLVLLAAVGVVANSDRLLRVEGTVRTMRRPPPDGDARPGAGAVPAAPGVVPP